MHAVDFGKLSPFLQKTQKSRQLTKTTDAGVIRFDMDKVEASKVLEKELSHFRENSYKELCGLIDSDPSTKEVVVGAKTYQVSITTYWDDKPEDNIWVIGSIDDGGLSAIIPTSQDFIMAPSGEFIDE